MIQQNDLYEDCLLSKQYRLIPQRTFKDQCGQCYHYDNGIQTHGMGKVVKKKKIIRKKRGKRIDTKKILKQQRKVKQSKNMIISNEKRKQQVALNNMLQQIISKQNEDKLQRLTQAQKELIDLRDERQNRLNLLDQQLARRNTLTEHQRIMQRKQTQERELGKIGIELANIGFQKAILKNRQGVITDQIEKGLPSQLLIKQEIPRQDQVRAGVVSQRKTLSKWTGNRQFEEDMPIFQQQQQQQVHFAREQQAQQQSQSGSDVLNEDYRNIGPIPNRSDKTASDQQKKLDAKKSEWMQQQKLQNDEEYRDELLNDIIQISDKSDDKTSKHSGRLSDKSDDKTSKHSGRLSDILEKAEKENKENKKKNKQQIKQPLQLEEEKEQKQQRQRKPRKERRQKEKPKTVWARRMEQQRQQLQQEIDNGGISKLMKKYKDIQMDNLSINKQNKILSRYLQLKKIKKGIITDPDEIQNEYQYARDYLDEYQQESSGENDSDIQRRVKMLHEEYNKDIRDLGTTSQQSKKSGQKTSAQQIAERYKQQQQQQQLQNIDENDEDVYYQTQKQYIEEQQQDIPFEDFQDIEDSEGQYSFGNEQQYYTNQYLPDGLTYNQVKDLIEQDFQNNDFFNYEIQLATKRAQKIKDTPKEYNIVLFLFNQHFTIGIFDRIREEVVYMDPLAENKDIEDVIDIFEDLLIRASPELKMKFKYNMKKWQQNPNKMRSLYDSTFCGLYCAIFAINYCYGDSWQEASTFDKNDQQQLFQYANNLHYGYL